MFVVEYPVFDIVPAIIGIIFVIVIGIFVVAIVRGIAQWQRNNHAEQETHRACIVTKRIDVDHYGNGDKVSSSTTTYYVTFELENGERREFRVSGKLYGQLAEKDQGELQFQGTRFLSFQRNV